MWLTPRRSTCLGFQLAQQCCWDGRQQSRQALQAADRLIPWCSSYICKLTREIAQ